MGLTIVIKKKKTFTQSKPWRNACSGLTGDDEAGRRFYLLQTGLNQGVVAIGGSKAGWIALNAPTG